MSGGKRASLLLTTTALVCLAAGGFLMWDVTLAISPTPQEVPALGEWAKIYALALLAALGVAVVVWRRPVVQAQAVLETSPLGAGPTGSLFDWRGYLATLMVVETLAFASVLVLDDLRAARPPANWLGLAGCAAVVAFMLHLIWRQVRLQRKGGGRHD